MSFSKPADGAHIAGGVLVEMAADGITIEPAGEVHEGAGHFHVIADDGCVDPGAAVPKDADHIHFGKAQTSGTIYLGPGEHELCLQTGDGAHVALEPTDRITVDVGVRDRDEWCAVTKEVDDLFLTADTAGGSSRSARASTGHPPAHRAADRWHRPGRRVGTVERRGRR